MRMPAKRFRAVDVTLALGLVFAGCAAAFAGTIAVPWIGQKSWTECGRAVLASLAARRGGDIEQLYARLPAPPDRLRGYSIAEMQRFATTVGVRLALQAPAGLVIAGDCTPRPPVTAHFKRLGATVSAGSPVVVPVSVGFGAGHYLVLVGAESGAFTALDPSARGLQRISTADLAARMCDSGYLALVAR